MVNEILSSVSDGSYLSTKYDISSRPFVRIANRIHLQLKYYTRNSAVTVTFEVKNLSLNSNSGYCTRFSKRFEEKIVTDTRSLLLEVENFKNCQNICTTYDSFYF